MGKALALTLVAGLALAAAAPPVCGLIAGIALAARGDPPPEEPPPPPPPPPPEPI